MMGSWENDDSWDDTDGDDVAEPLCECTDEYYGIECGAFDLYG